MYVRHMYLSDAQPFDNHIGPASINRIDMSKLVTFEKDKSLEGNGFHINRIRPKSRQTYIPAYNQTNRQYLTLPVTSEGKRNSRKGKKQKLNWSLFPSGTLETIEKNESMKQKKKKSYEFNEFPSFKIVDPETSQTSKEKSNRGNEEGKESKTSFPQLSSSTSSEKKRRWGGGFGNLGTHETRGVTANIRRRKRLLNSTRRKKTTKRNSSIKASSSRKKAVVRSSRRPKTSSIYGGKKYGKRKKKDGSSRRKEVGKKFGKALDDDRPGSPLSGWNTTNEDDYDTLFNIWDFNSEMIIPKSSSYERNMLSPKVIKFGSKYGGRDGNMEERPRNRKRMVKLYHQ